MAPPGAGSAVPRSAAEKAIPYSSWCRYAPAPSGSKHYSVTRCQVDPQPRFDLLQPLRTQPLQQNRQQVILLRRPKTMR
jgi:hypothetical protein